MFFMNWPRPLNIGLIGGASGSFIAAPHQKAVHFDGTRKVTSVALSSKPEKALRDAGNWPYPVEAFGSYDEMIRAQAAKAPGDRLDYVVVTTPNHAHLDPALKALDAGIPVFCEKPLTLTLAEADQLVAKVRETGLPFGVAHTYVGHWSSWFCREIIKQGLLGEIRWVDAYYLQGWLADTLESSGLQQAVWRTDPAKAGISGAGGDIGIHALEQLRFVTGLDVKRICAHCECLVPGRLIDDHFTVYGELSNGGKCLVRASQICHGHLNDLGLVVAGTKALLKWRQEDAEAVTVCLPGQPDRTYWRGSVAANDGFLNDLPSWLVEEPTIPAGHVEGLHDAFARLHREFEKDVRKYQAGEAFDCDGSRYANVEDGRMGMAFIEAAVASHKNNNAWTAVSLSAQ